MNRRLILPGVLLFLLGMFVARLPALIGHFSGREDWLAAVVEVQQLIDARYVEGTTPEALLEGAIAGMTRSLNDPYTEFIPPRSAAAFEKEITGRFVGIGATITIEDGWLTIASPIEDSPALRAGLRAGDRIIEIDGKHTRGFSMQDAIDRLTGVEKTPVRLAIDRAGARSEVTIERAAVAAPSVGGYFYDDARQAWNYLIDPKSGVAYVRVSQFTDTVSAELNRALESAAKAMPGGPARGVKGLVMDLRDNPGGVLDEAVAIADLFMDSGTIVSTRGRTNAGDTFSAVPGGLTDIPIAVIVNAHSASASEVVAGALADNRRAVVVGTRTFGKGLVQAVVPMNSLASAVLKVTEQRYFLPSGRMIHRTDDSPTWGVDPSDGFYVPLDETQAREARRAWLAMSTVRPAGAPVPDGIPAAQSWADPAWLAGKLKDPQLAAAVDAVQQRIATGVWRPTGSPLPSGENQADSIATRELRRLDAARERLLRELASISRRMDALQLAAGEKPPIESNARPDSLWADALEVTGGRMDIFDASGARVATLDITGPDVERWLLDADVRPKGWVPPPPANEPAKPREPQNP